MEKNWTKSVTKYDILKKLVKYKKLGYNHVTYLGGEPFIQPVFLDALKIGKKMGYTILVTTNCTTLHIESQAKKFLPYIDDLIISFEALDKDLQQKISRTQVYVRWEEVFENIKKYWKGNFIKVNIVITNDNVGELMNMVQYLHMNGFSNISLTYPDLETFYYGKEYTADRIAPTYAVGMHSVLKVYDYSVQNNITLKIVDFPFCVFPKDKMEQLIPLTDDYDYDGRLKIDGNEKEINRSDLQKKELVPRNRKHTNRCRACIYKKKCWGISADYKLLFGLKEISPILS